MIGDINLILVLITLLTLGACAYVALYPRWVLPVFFVWVGLADFFKRVIWLPSGASPSELEYQLALLTPDLILAAGVARLGYDMVIRRQLREQYQFHWMDVPIGLYFIWSTLSIFNPETSLRVGLIGFKSATLYILLYAIVRVQAQSLPALLNRLKYPLIAIGLVAAFYGFYQALAGYTAYEERWLQNSGTGLGTYNPEGDTLANTYGYTLALGDIIRIFSTFASHEQLGIFMGMVIIFLYLYPMQPQWKALLLVIFGFTLMRTLSRSSWVFTAGATMVLVAGSILLNNRRQLIYAVAIPIVMVLGYGVWNIYTTATAEDEVDEITVEETTDADGNSVDNTADAGPIELFPQEPNNFTDRALVTGTFEYREYTFEALLELPDWHKPFGNGIGSMWTAWRLGVEGTENISQEEYQQYGVDVPGKRLHSHVGIVDVIYELGILGLILFLWAFGSAVWYGGRYLLFNRTAPDRETVLVGMAIILSIMAINSTFATLLHLRPVAAPLWFAFGLVAATTLNRAPTTVAENQ